MAADPTKVNVKESSIGSFHQNLLWRSMKSFIHVIDPISHHRPQSLSIFLHEQGDRHMFICWKQRQSFIASLVIGVYLEFLQLVLNINCQGWIHGLILVDEVLESKRKGNHESCHEPYIIVLFLVSAIFPPSPYLVEKSLKSPRRSHTRRPVRDALLEYAGPMPFLVVPML